MIELSVIFQAWWWAIFGGIGGVVYIFMEAKKRSRKFREILDRLALKAPVFGDIVYKAAIARFARTLSTMFAAGVPMVDAMESVAGATGNIVYEVATKAMKDEVASGQQLQWCILLSRSRCDELRPTAAILAGHEDAPNSRPSQKTTPRAVARNDL